MRALLVITIVTASSNVMLAPTIIGVAAAQESNWGCYDPQPGHPTLEEKRAFLERFIPLAREAERRHAVPAAALTAMAVVESGFGFTRLAQNGRNYFGWKYSSAGSAGGRPFWTLACQPPEDVNNRYIAFTSEADGVDFVAARLASSPYYKVDTQQYRKDSQSGVDPMLAARRWVKGVADPYNWKPDLYARTIIRVMNAPLAPSDLVATDANLYAMAGPHRASSDSDALAKTKSALAGFAFGRYMEVNCTPTSLPGWEAFPVGLCRYMSGASGVPAEVALLDPTDEQAHRWIASACVRINATNIGTCARKIAKRIRAQSGAQFPVAGIVLEDMDGNGRLNQFAFRDGVTVSVVGVVNGAELAPTAAANEAALYASPTTAKIYARIAGTTRAQYAAFTGRPLSEFDGLKWLRETRAAYQQAWGADSNALIDSWAHANKEALGGQ